MTDRPKLGLRYGHAEPEVRAAQGNREPQDAAMENTLVSHLAMPTITHPDPYWVIYRCIPKGYARAAKPPRFRHATMQSAVDEAYRLARQHPESTFVILQEVATVRVEGLCPA